MLPRGLFEAAIPWSGPEPAMSHESRSPQLARTFSSAGFGAVLVGLGLIAFELRYNLLLHRLGVPGRVVLVTCAIGFSIWGLQELIANWWPQLSRRGFARHRSALPVEGRAYIVVMIVLFCGALLGRSNPLLLVFALMAGPFVANAWISFVLLKRLTVTRYVPERVMAGEPTSVELALRNNKQRLSAWVMTLRDQITSQTERLPAEVLIPRVPPLATRTGHYRLRLMHRGRHEFGPVSISTRFPLGLVERSLTVAQSGSILVYPRLGRLTARWTQRLQHATDLVPLMAPRSGPFHDEFHKLREYRRGDDVRAIHWKTSARRNELMVREFRESRDRELVVLLDPWRPARPTDQELERSELAISLAATICIHHLRNSRDSHLYFAVHGEPFGDWDSSAGATESLLDLLALLTPASSSDLSRLRSAAAAHGSSRARMLLISTRPSVARLEWSRRGQRTSDGHRWVDAIEIVDVDPQQLSEIVEWRRMIANRNGDDDANGRKGSRCSG
jgi:uncharacterized protein (DUF58 family)